jgi:hypothetical protein
MDSASKPAPNAVVATLESEGHKVRSFIASNRSDTLLRLFDFLLQRSIEGDRPREAEIAEEIFGVGVTTSEGQGSRVRVGIHRLRKKLDLYYADNPGPRLFIPQGEYGFVIKSADEEIVPAVPASAVQRSIRALWLAVGMIVLINLAFAWFQLGGTAGFADRSRRSALWEPFDSKKRPTIIAIGDYFMFMSSQNHPGVEEVTQDLSIDTIDAFYEYVASTAGARENVRNMNLYAVSSDILGSIGSLWSYLGEKGLKPVASSDLDAGMLKSSNVVYVGALDALTPLLGNPLFQASKFSCSNNCYELVDKSSGKRFLSDSPYILDDMIIPRRDYGYIASYPGPSGNQIVVISGTGDAGVAQMMNVVTDPKKIQDLRKKIGGNFKSFEALFQVRTMFNQSYNSSLVLARPLNADPIWDKTKRRSWRLVQQPAS